MAQQKLDKVTIQMVEDLKKDLNEILEMESNIEVIWRLEKLQAEQAFKKSADYIRKALKL